MSTIITSLADAAQRALDLLVHADGRRVLIGLVGAPGAGKSTLSAAIVGAVGRSGRSSYRWTAST